MHECDVLGLWVEATKHWLIAVK